MGVPTPLVQVAIPAVAIAAVMAFLPIGMGLIVLIALIVACGIARGVARSSESGRWISTGIYAGALLGFLLSLMRGIG
ncbi:MAG: hypothetical protein AB7R89_33870 [Dehalococcoidia bacterium]